MVHRFQTALFALFLGLSVTFIGPAHRALAADSAQWATVLENAKGQTVYWNAWSGDEKINAYIAWVGERVAEEYGVTLRHVKVSDTASVVARVLAESTAGRDEGGSVDLVWINGENFLTMKQAELLYGPFTELLPNTALTDPETNPGLLVDFTIPTDGLESPWGLSQFVIAYDTARVPEPPRTLEAMAEWITANPGRFAYPAPPDFIGTTFLKQILAMSVADPAVLAAPVEEAQFNEVTAPLWAWLETVRPGLWRKGEVFPTSGPALRSLLNDGEVDFYLSFHAGDATSAIAQGQIPETVRTYIPEPGSIANTHFVAIPFNANAKDGAKVVANFLLSPEAQARKFDPTYWGDDTVLSLELLNPKQRDAFDAVPPGIATLAPNQRGLALPEPHPSWMSRIEKEWHNRHSL
ncbi:MAG: ABC transporter substrate-binding protein [Rhodospirillaceae bacterium]